MHEGKGEEVLRCDQWKGQGKHEGIAVLTLSDVHCGWRDGRGCGSQGKEMVHLKTGKGISDRIV